MLYVAFTAIRGGGPRRYERAAILVLGDLVLQLLLLALGLALLFQPEVLTDPASIAGAPSLEDMVFAFPLVLVAFSGIDASSGLAGPGQDRPRRAAAADRRAAGGGVVPYVGIALVASSVLPQTGDRWVEAPLLGVADAFEQAWLREPPQYLVAISALIILVSRRPGRDARPLAARLRALGQPPDPVALRLAAPARGRPRSGSSASAR